MKNNVSLLAVKIRRSLQWASLLLGHDSLLYFHVLMLMKRNSGCAVAV